MKKALYLAFSDRSIMNRIASNADFSSLRSRNLPSRVQNCIENLLLKQKESTLNSEEEKELDKYEELDDYLSLVNRTVRSLYLT